MDRVFCVTAGAFGTGVLQLSPRVLQATKSRVRFACTRRTTLRRGLTHRLGRLVQLTSCFLQLRVVVFSGQSLQLPRCLFSLVGEITLRLCSRSGAALLALLSPPALAFSFLFLSAREFLELFHECVDLIIRLLLFSSANGFVLVLELVEFQFEQISEVFGRGLASATTATAALLLLLHVALVRLFRLL